MLTLQIPLGRQLPRIEVGDADFTRKPSLLGYPNDQAREPAV